MLAAENRRACGVLVRMLVNGKGHSKDSKEYEWHKRVNKDGETVERISPPSTSRDFRN